MENENTLKKNPGIAGLTSQLTSQNRVPGTRAQIYDAKNKLLGTVYGDADGFYMWPYKYTGKPATFYVKLPAYGKSQMVTLKANGFPEVNLLDLP